MGNGKIEQDLPGNEKGRSHYDWDALERLGKYQTLWGTMEEDGCRLKKDFLLGMFTYDFLYDISGYIDDFCIHWMKWTRSPGSKKVSPQSLPYEQSPPEDFKLAATLKIKTSELEFRTTINEQSARNFMDYLRELDEAGLNVNDVSAKITTSKAGRSYSMTFQRAG
jgi:hypothetical protein